MSGDEIVSKCLRDLAISSETQGASVCKESSHCNLCLEKHVPDQFCAGWKCRVCHKFHGEGFFCPYLHCLPKYADFNRQEYEVTCTCGNPFNEDRWSCTSCPSTWAVLQRKSCIICNSTGHAMYECPVDEVRSARYKLAREKTLATVPEFIPFHTVDLGPRERNYAPFGGIVDKTDKSCEKIPYHDPVYPAEWFAPVGAK